MKASKNFLLIGTLLFFLAASFVPAQASAQFCGPQAQASGYTIVNGSVYMNGRLVVAAGNGVYAVSVSGNTESFSVTFRYQTWQGLRQYHAIYGFAQDGTPFAWNASKSELIVPALPYRR